MRTILSLVFLYLAIIPVGRTQISLVGARAGSGTVDIVKWQAFDPMSVTIHPSPLQGYVMGSSVFDAYNSNYYLTGLTSTSFGLLTFNTVTNDTVMSPSASLSGITEIDMSTGKIYNLTSGSPGYIAVYEYDISTGTDSLLGVISEPGIPGIISDATGFDSDNGILYYAGIDGSNSLCLFAIEVRNPVFTYSKTPLLSTTASIFGVNYDNINDKLFACSSEYDTTFTFIGFKVVEIDKTSGEVLTRGWLDGVTAYVAGSSSFDQNSGSLMIIGFDTNNAMSMILFDTYSNTYQTGFVPGMVSEVVCDNYQFAQERYGIVSVSEKENPGVSIFPNPATGRFTLQVKELEGTPTIRIHHLSGREVYTGQIRDSRTEISTVSLAKGLYFVTLERQKGYQTHRLIVD